MSTILAWLRRLLASARPERFESPSGAHPDALSLIADMVGRQRAARRGWVSLIAPAPDREAVVEFADDRINTCEAEIDLRATLIAAGEPDLASLIDSDPSDRTTHRVARATPSQLAGIIRIILIAEHGAAPDDALRAELHD